MDINVLNIYNVLLEKHGYQNWWPIVKGDECLYLNEYRERERTEEEILEIMVGTILTQNTSWENVKKALIQIKENGILNINSLNKIKLPQLAALIKTSGYYNQKAKKIKTLMQFINGSLKGNLLELKKYSLIEARKMLLSIWGIGQETADSILLYGFYYPVFVVDAYTKRIFSRIGSFDEKSSYNAVQEYFHKNLPADRLIYQEYHALLVEVGKHVCRKKRNCFICGLSELCRTAGQSTISAHKCT